MTDAVAGDQRQVAIVAHRSRDLVGPLRLRLGRARGSRQRGRPRPARAAVAGADTGEPLTPRVERAWLGSSSRRRHAGRLPPVDEFRRNLLQVATRHRDAHVAELGTGHGEREIEPSASAGDADIEQATFLGRATRFARRHLVRQQALLDPGEEDGLVFEALRGVQGHERDRSARVVQLVGRGDEGGFGEELEQRALRVPHPVFARLRDQFLHVLRARLVLRVARGTQRLDESGPLEQRDQDLRHRKGRCLP